ncbi:hypothetical protein LCGC14_0547540 [marine sediment metagenome]|uniref:Uncharacterized protein n=1 Tax=marine sediment metagenome TaxID=412755 RepID=A0A0F9S9C6_9ZZZZ
MSEPTPPPASDPKPPTDADKGKDKGKGLDKFINPDGTLIPVEIVDNKPQMLIDPPVIEDKDFKEEFEKLQKKQYNTERKVKLIELTALNPEVAEKYKSKKLSDIETAIDVAKVSAPKFPVNREAPVAEAAPRGGFLNRRTGKWE